MRKFKWTTASLTGGFIAIAVVTGASAVTDNVFRYTSEKTGYYTINHWAFAPDQTGAVDDYATTNGLSTSTSACFGTGVNLPHGAKITGLDVYSERVGSTGSSNLRVVFRRLRLSDNFPESLTDVTLTGATNGYKREAVAIDGSATSVSNIAFSYGLYVCVLQHSKLYSARIRYTYTHAGD